MKKAQEIINKLVQETKTAAEDVQRQYESSALKRNVDQTISAADDLLAQSGARDEFSKAKGAIDKSLDSFSGKKIMEELAKHIALQEQYNDVLAGKLEEALNRIEDLERKSRGQ